jgi:hypothetical protein
MADVQMIIATDGPLPVEMTTTIESDAEVALTLSGSVWSSTPDSEIGITLEIDGETVTGARIFSNGPSTHRAVVPITVPYTFTIGEHTFRLLPATEQTTSDSNDYFYLTVLY